MGSSSGGRLGGVNKGQRGFLQANHFAKALLACPRKPASTPVFLFDSSAPKQIIATPVVYWRALIALHIGHHRQSHVLALSHFGRNLVAPSDTLGQRCRLLLENDPPYLQRYVSKYNRSGIFRQRISDRGPACMSPKGSFSSIANTYCTSGDANKAFLEAIQ